MFVILLIAGWNWIILQLGHWLIIGLNFCSYKIELLTPSHCNDRSNNDLILATSTCINLLAKPDGVFVGQFRELHSEAYIDQILVVRLKPYALEMMLSVCCRLVCWFSFLDHNVLHIYDILYGVYWKVMTLILRSLIWNR